MEGLCEGIAQSDHPSLATWAAALHHNTGHLHQLDGTLSILKRLSQIQHLRGHRVKAWTAEAAHWRPTAEKVNRICRYTALPICMHVILKNEMFQREA